MSGQDQKKRARPGGDQSSHEDEKEDAQIDRNTAAVREGAEKLLQAIRDANNFSLGFSGMCCDRCGCPCHPDGGCLLTPICSDGVHPCPQC